MFFVSRLLLIFLPVLLSAIPISAVAQQQTVWWHFCDSCSSDSSFAQRAYSAPTGYEWVYVSNRTQNKTLKYQRITTLEDLGNGYVWMTHVLPVTLSAQEKNVLEDAIEGANITAVDLTRDDLAGLVPGLGPTSSFMGDFSGLRLNPRFSDALIRNLENSGVLPTLEQVNQSVEALGIAVESGFTIRARNLSIVIEYEDGSSIAVILRPDGTLASWSATDADGEVIDLDADDDGDVRIDDGSLGSGFTIVVGGTDDPSVQEGVNEFMLAFDRLELHCRTDVIGPQRIELRCAWR